MEPAFSRVVQGAAAVIAVASVLIGLEEAGSHPDHAAAVLVVRFAVALLLAASILPLGSPRPMLRRWTAEVLVVVVTAANLPVLLLTNSESTFWLLPGIPLYAALLLGRRESIALSTLAVVAVGAGVWMVGSPLARFFTAGSLHLGVAVVFATYTVSVQGRVKDALRRDQLRRAEMEKAQAHGERLATVGRMVAGIAHEINNPLAVIRSNVSFLAKPGTTSPEELSEVLADTAASADRIQQLVKDMRKFTRRETGTSECVIAEVLEPAVRLARAGAATAAALKLDVGVEALRVRMNAVRLEQVILVLLENAIDAVANSADPHVEISLRADKMEARLRVRDNGTGIPDEILPRLFEPFFTTKEPGKGTGLGLALAHEFVMAAGGRITASNAPDGGAVFEVVLPLVPGSPRAAATPTVQMSVW